MRKMLDTGKAAKAWMAMSIASIAYLVPVVNDGVSWGETLGSLAAGLVAFQAVYWTTNDPA